MDLAIQEAQSEAAFESRKPSLAELASKRLPITVPWSSDHLFFPGQTFHSNLYKTADPWSKTSPFEDWSANELTNDSDVGQMMYLSANGGTTGTFKSAKTQSTMMYLSADGGTTGTFKSAKTQSTVLKEDHESFGFTATVDLGFCTASGSLQYDRNISTNDDNIKTSVRASYRCGSIILRRPPKLSQESSLALKYGEGLTEFEAKYGDYFVYGYNLGADNAMLVSTNASSLSTQERKTLTVKAECFLFDVEFTEHFDSASYSASAALNITGYDTLSGSTLDEHTKWQASTSVEFDAVQRRSRTMRLLGDQLPSRVEDACEELGLRLGQGKANRAESARTGLMQDFAPVAGLEKPVDRATCRRVMKSNVIVEVVLMPVKSLRSVQEWMYSDDII
ncbi:hypothetical protein CBOM_04878 [Ceraceosorus bombacis]|uniref:Uncharacterized protein n=1 Tax=Ceraceosorus bombacis TaxID=401625 RepID=A0A0P1BQY7_9BASI|nr:hypothetical protein CBOM_04878 [Ceraceosorus bombacis]